MARTRLELHEILCGILGSRNCYFTAPSNGMEYPCIKYELVGKKVDYADNIPYKTARRWTLIVIDEDEDSEIPDRLEQLPYCSFDRRYTTSELNHFVFTLYF